MRALQEEIQRIKSEVAEISSNVFYDESIEERLLGRDKMATYLMRLDFLCADAVYMILEIWKRMGWQYDDLDEKMRTRVNVPIGDMELFNFIMDSFGY